MEGNLKERGIENSGMWKDYKDWSRKKVKEKLTEKMGVKEPLTLMVLPRHSSNRLGER